MTRINKDLILLNAGNDYWKATLKDRANQQDLRQLHISKEYGKLRPEPRRRTNENQ
jgi:hypothetical protein